MTLPERTVSDGVTTHEEGAVLRRIATIVTAVGLLAAIAGWLWNLVAPTVDANIGAGMLVVLGLPVTAIGLVLLIVNALLLRRE